MFAILRLSIASSPAVASGSRRSCHVVDGGQRDRHGAISHQRQLTNERKHTSCGNRQRTTADRSIKVACARVSRELHHPNYSRQCKRRRHLGAPGANKSELSFARSASARGVGAAAVDVGSRRDVRSESGSAMQRLVWRHPRSEAQAGQAEAGVPLLGALRVAGPRRRHRRTCRHAGECLRR